MLIMYRIIMIILFDPGFAGNQLDGRNVVTFINEADERDILECDIVSLHTSASRIACDTR